MRIEWLAGLAAALVMCVSSGGAARTRLPAFKIATGPGAIMRIGCRQGECRWQRRLRAAILSRSRDEAVVRLTVREATTVHADDIYPATWRHRAAAMWRDRIDYVRCSRIRPAVLWRDDDGGRFYLHQLSLRALAGYQYDSATEYLLACHGVPPGGSNDRVLARLGYGVTPSEQVIFDTRAAALRAIGVRP